MNKRLSNTLWYIALLVFVAAQLSDALPLVARDPLDGQNTIELPSTS